MARMNIAVRSIVLIALGFAVTAPGALTQTQTGSIEFIARATPSGGIEEPVRGFPFFLLSRSFEDISEEVDASLPKPDMDAFIDKLDVSKELKTWMKKKQWVQLSGEDFIHKLKPDDIMGVPEFHDAYIHRNSGDETENFPKPKYKPADRTKDPAKYDRLKADYTEAVRHYIEQVPDSIDGIDLELADIDPSAKWNSIEGKRAPELHRRVLELAQSKYLVARTQTNLEGEGYLRGITPGNYWLTTLDVAANVGDARPRWDASLMVRAGEQAHVTLSNVNAVTASTTAP
jgi:hypothetical protein